MKTNYINVVFVLDESGSMWESTKDVIGGFNKVVEEQKKVVDGKCTVCLYKFNNNATEVYVGKDVNEIEGVEYFAGGMTSLYDGVGKAITNVGKWLADMNEDERPSKNLVVIMTDGEENNSTEYTKQQIKEMIEHQTTKYNWEFVYMGTDITNSHDAKSLGISKMSFSSRNKYANNYDIVNCSLSAYRCEADLESAQATMDSILTTSLNCVTAEYEAEIGKNIL